MHVETPRSAPATVEPVIRTSGLNFFYGSFQALFDVSLDVAANHVTALIGPSGCGKSTFLRCLNRMNDLIEGSRIEGTVTIQGTDIYGPNVDPVELRKSIGMVFQKPNPFPMSIFDNIAFGPRIHGIKKRSELEEIVERCLKQAYLYEEVKDKLHKSALELSGGQQQRLCIARSLAVDPKIILMDEPCSALDPVATARIEDLMFELKELYTIVIVTHNMQQAARVSDATAFFSTEVNPDSDVRTGLLVEFDRTATIFSNPRDQRTENYITGRFG